MMHSQAQVDELTRKLESAESVIKNALAFADSLEIYNPTDLKKILEEYELPAPRVYRTVEECRAFAKAFDQNIEKHRQQTYPSDRLRNQLPERRHHDHPTP